jgi:hypothetical protein
MMHGQKTSKYTVFSFPLAVLQRVGKSAYSCDYMIID